MVKCIRKSELLEKYVVLSLQSGGAEGGYLYKLFVVTADSEKHLRIFTYTTRREMLRAHNRVVNKILKDGVLK